MLVNLEEILHRLAIDFDIDLQTVAYCSQRLKNEGGKFLTSVLPKLSKTVLLAVELGSFRMARAQTQFTDIQWKGGLLRFFRRHLLQIFDQNGVLLENPCPVALYAIRQFCEYFYKLALPFSESDMTEAEENFISTDKELSTAPFNWQFINQLRKDLLNHYGKFTHATFDGVLREYKPRPGPGTYSTHFLRSDELAPELAWDSNPTSSTRAYAQYNRAPYYMRSGRITAPDNSILGSYRPYPGSPSRRRKIRENTSLLSRIDCDPDVGKCTNDGILPSKSESAGDGLATTYSVQDGIHRIRRPSNACRYPITGRYRNSVSEQKPLFPRDESLSVPVELVSEVLFVPKDSRGPRTIVREPYDNLIHQMAFFDWASSTLQNLTKGHIQFTDQSINRDLARVSSRNGHWSTLDLKDASDRVSYAVINFLFEETLAPKVFLRRYRTKYALLPSGRVMRLSKLSGMGSGFTFVSMALLIYLAIVREIVNQYGLRYETAQGMVYVYGDDICVASRFTAAASAALEKVGLKINLSKSYHRGHFRESCGGDYYRGEDVTPVRLRLANSDNKLINNGNILSVNGSHGPLLVERHCRELVKAGFQALPSYLYEVLERSLNIKLPQVSGESPIMGRYSIFTPEYATDQTGAYRKIRAFTAISEHKVGFEDPYVHLGKHVRRKQEPAQLNHLNAHPPNKIVGLYTVPRTLRYGWVELSAFRLMG